MISYIVNRGQVIGRQDNLQMKRKQVKYTQHGNIEKELITKATFFFQKSTQLELKKALWYHSRKRYHRNLKKFL